MSKFTPTPAEVALINQIFAQYDTQKLGVITGDVAVKIFSGSKLSPSVLAEVWNIADEDNNGVLTRKGVGIAVRLLGHAQRGEQVSEALVTKPGPIPTIEGLPPVSVPGIPPAKSPPPHGFPPLTPADKSKFLKLFLGCHPTNGILSADKARDVFVKSKLPVDKLSAIWSLADTKNRGALDATDFTIAMYLIQASMSGQLQTIPSSLPPFIYEQASNGVVPQATGGSGHMSPSLTGGFPGHSVQPQYTGQALSQLQPQMTGQGFSSIQPQMTGPLRSTPGAPPLPARSALSSSGPAFPFVQQQTTGAQWDVTPQEKASSDRIFDSLDTQKRGYIEGDVAVPFMLQSKLPEDVLAQVWDLSDINNDGRLTRDGFAVAMHLIQGKLAGKDIPSTLPASLIPPSMRASVLASHQPAQPAVPEAIKDLLWDDSPPASATAATYSQSILQPQSTGVSAMSGSGRPASTMSPPPRAPQAASDPFANSPFGFSAGPAPNKDLLGDDDEPHAASPPLQDQSAEIGNVKNQLNSTNRSLETAKAERANVERQLTEQAALLSSLQTQLSSAKAAYDIETKLLSTLRERFAAQSAEIQKTREELIHAESDLSASKVEKAELEGAFLRDKEEVRDLNRKMHEVGTQIESVKAELERLKREAKQQKGLLAIAKKQLNSRETEKAKVDKEMEEAKAELQEITKEREAAEAELSSSKEETATAFSNGHVSPAPTPDPTVAFAAAQPLPASMPTSPDVSPPASVIGKSTNPFERLAMSSSPRPESPFLPFAATPVLPTPPTAPAAQEAAPEDPFGFNEAFSAPEEPQVEASESQTPKPASAIPGPLSIGSPNAQEIVSPAETDLFSTPPTTATGSQHVMTPPHATQFPALENIVDEDSAPTPTVAPPTATPQNPQVHGDDTDLAHELKEIEEADSDSDSDSSDDDEPLTSVKAKLTDQAEAHTNGTAAAEPSGTSAFDDSFGVTGSEVEEPLKEAAQPAPVASPPTKDISTMFETPAVSKEAPLTATIPATVETPKLNGAAMAPSAGVSEFDQALSKISNKDNSAPASGFTDFGFDSAFDDNFDFAAASAAQPTQLVADASAAAAAFPPPPTVATAKATSFDDVFGTTGVPNVAATSAQAPAVPAFPPVSTPPAQPSQPLSFDDAFSAGPSRPAQDLAASTSTASNGTISGFSFDDAFGANDGALSLDNSFTSQASTQYQPPPGPPPTKAAHQPFPSSSPAASPRGSSSTQGGRPSSPLTRHASPPPRHASPPPRHSSPRPRPSTADSAKEKGAATRHNRLSIRLPFGRKKKQHDTPPVPALAQQQIIEDPTPAVEDDVEAVKTLCGMGFSRTQAVTALEEHGYDVQKALNSLLGSQ
ncbi:hypothetical protein OH76DRAFT_1488480 [Lentinus brumalis]|uniref:EF-hand n=1 Tax=Lentinus brumalis TaxID=2498619 RepID=A0A371CQX4_9APHY|nr:hypothetical protein OH76DRAFT_1488480 [Polyporus brumalis]